jgi:fatty-acyl-CoA synthase
MALAGRFDSLAAAHPDRPYVITDSQSYSYRDMQEWSRQLARGLHEIGVRPGERVALVVDNRPRFVAVKLAVARLGAVAVPVNFSYRADELAAVLNSCEASVLISIDAAIGVDRLTVLDELVPGWEGGATSDVVPHLRRVVLVSSERRPDGLDLRGLLAAMFAGGAIVPRPAADGHRRGAEYARPHRHPRLLQQPRAHRRADRRRRLASLW